MPVEARNGTKCHLRPEMAMGGLPFRGRSGIYLPCFRYVPACIRSRRLTRCILVEFRNLPPELRNRIGCKKQPAKLHSAISAMRRLRTASHAKFTADVICELGKQCGGRNDGTIGDHDAIADGLEIVTPPGVMLCLFRRAVVLEAVVFDDELLVGPE